MKPFVLIIRDCLQIDPKPCSTKAAIKSKKNSQYPKIFLGGLPFNVTETDLRSIFSKYGEVMDVIIMYDHEKNKCRGNCLLFIFVVEPLHVLVAFDNVFAFSVFNLFLNNFVFISALIFFSFNRANLV